MPRLLDDKEIGMIKRYFDFDLSEKELEGFVHRLETDAVFAKEVETYEEAYNAVDEWIIGSKAEVADTSVEREVKGNNTTDSTKKNPLKWIVAIVLLSGLLLFGYFMTLEKGISQADERIFAQIDEYTNQMTDDVLRGDVNLTTPVSDEEKALKDIVSVYKEDTADATITALGDYINSIKNPINQELAEWWLVNIHLKNENIDQAKIILEGIKNNPNYNSSKKASGFLESL